MTIVSCRCPSPARRGPIRISPRRPTARRSPSGGADGDARRPRRSTSSGPSTIETVNGELKTAAGHGPIPGTGPGQGAVRGAVERAGLQHRALSDAVGEIGELGRISRPGSTWTAWFQPHPSRQWARQGFDGRQKGRLSRKKRFSISSAAKSPPTLANRNNFTSSQRTLRYWVLLELKTDLVRPTNLVISWAGEEAGPARRDAHHLATGVRASRFLLCCLRTLLFNVCLNPTDRQCDRRACQPLSPQVKARPRARARRQSRQWLDTGISDPLIGPGKASSVDDS